MLDVFNISIFSSPAISKKDLIPQESKREMSTTMNKLKIQKGKGMSELTAIKNT